MFYLKMSSFHLKAFWPDIQKYSFVHGKSNKVPSVQHAMVPMLSVSLHRPLALSFCLSLGLFMDRFSLFSEVSFYIFPELSTLGKMGCMLDYYGRVIQANKLVITNDLNDLQLKIKSIMIRNYSCNILKWSAANP